MMYKTCSNRRCKHKGEPQQIRNFSRRSGTTRFKKDGVTPQYISHCKSCGVSAQNERVKKKRAEAKAKKLGIKQKLAEIIKIIKPTKAAPLRYCVDCSKKVSKYAARCAGCNTLYQLKDPIDKFEGKMDARFTNPRGSKMRKKMGLEPIDFSGSREYTVAVNA